MNDEDTKKQVKSLLGSLKNGQVKEAITMLELWLDDLDITEVKKTVDGETFSEYLTRTGLPAIGLYAKEAENAEADS